MKIVFAGTPDVAVPSLKALAEAGGDIEVAGVLTRPDAPKGRGRKLAKSPVKEAAENLGIPVLDMNPRDQGFLDALAAFDAQAAAVVAYGNILKQNVLDAMPQGWYNLHFSLLPQWRGAAPVQRAIWSGDTVTGATVFRITAGLDSGPIIAQSTTDIDPRETSGSLFSKLAADGAILLTRAMQLVAQGRAIPVPQETGSFETAAKITTADAHIRFDVPVFAADRQIRACTPEPGAWFTLHPSSDADGLTLHVEDAEPAVAGDTAAPTELAPGQISTDKHHVWIGTLTQPLELKRVKPQGRAAMDAAAWARGARLTQEAYGE